MVHAGSRHLAIVYWILQPCHLGDQIYLVYTTALQRDPPQSFLWRSSWKTYIRVTTWEGGLGMLQLMSSWIGRWSEIAKSGTADFNIGTSELPMKRSKMEWEVAEKCVGEFIGCWRECDVRKLNRSLEWGLCKAVMSTLKQHTTVLVKEHHTSYVHGQWKCW